jgi:hypothetical protein
MARDALELPGGLLAAMLADVAAPPSTVGDVAAAARIKSNVLARIGPPLPVRHEPGWRPWVDKAFRKTLFDNGVTRSWLVHMRPGASLPPHVHTDGDEECVVLAGEVWVDRRRFCAGDYSIALRGSRHDSVCTVTGALIYLRSPSPRAESESRAIA